MLGTFSFVLKTIPIFCMNFFLVQNILFFSQKKIYFDGTSLFLTQNNFVLGMFLFVPEQLLILTEIFFPQKYFCAQNNFLHLYLMAQLIGPFILLSDGLVGLPICEQKGHLCTVPTIIEH